MEEKSRERFAVILQEWETKIEIPDLANALVKTTGLLFADALILAGKTRGIIGRGLEKEKAEELISRAKELGADAFMVPESRLVKVPKVFNTTKLACLPENLFISLSPGNIVYSVDWKNIISISCGFIKQVTEIKKNWVKIFFDLLDTHLPYGPVGLVVAPFAVFEKWKDETQPSNLKKTTNNRDWIAARSREGVKKKDSKRVPVRITSNPPSQRFLLRFFTDQPAIINRIIT